MKTEKKIVIMLLSFLIAANAISAQTRKKKAGQKVKSKPVVVEKTPQERMFDEMLTATAQILIIDSIVVDKYDFLKNIPFNDDAGHFTTYDKCFGQNTQSNKFVYVNSFNDKCYFAIPDTSRQQLCGAFRIGNTWSEPQTLNGIGDNFEAPDFPFMMADGITFYFAAKNDEGLGGYDIFNTILDTESNRFYKPQNIGLPFNSPANDYLYAISETDTLGWFVSDRNQPEDKVCIYTFVPTASRKNYDAESMTPEQLLKLASVASIADTWTDEAAKENALRRLNRLRSHNKSQDNEQPFTFIVNDQTIYHHIQDFKSPTNRQEFSQLLKKKERLEEEKRKLRELRTTYHHASTEQRKTLQHEIGEKENLCRTLNKEIHEQEKAIRNTENILIKKS